MLFRFLYGIPIMGDVHDHIDFKATPPLTRWDENLLRLTSIRKFMKNLVDKFPQIDIKLLDGKFIAPSIESLADDEFNIRGTFDEEQKSEQEKVGLYFFLKTLEILSYNMLYVRKVT